MSWMPEGNPQPGDLIEIFWPACQHWAIYVGYGCVVHLVPEGNHSGSDTSGFASFGIPAFGSYGTSSLGSIMHDYAEVKMEPLWKVADNGYQINNKYDAKYKRRPVGEIVTKAKAAVGTKMPYNLLNHNCEHFVTNLRYGIPVSDQVKPQPGDLIEISRTGCQHWAIYVGNGDVVHLVPEGIPHRSQENYLPQERELVCQGEWVGKRSRPSTRPMARNLSGSDISRLGSSGISGLGSVIFDYAVVKRETLWKVADNGYQINNKYDAKYKHRPVGEIISKAKAAVGTKMPYNLLNHNCEHFATNLRYGIPLSDQANSKKFSVSTVCAAICTAAFYANPIGTIAVAGSALLLRELWRRR